MFKKLIDFANPYTAYIKIGLLVAIATALIGVALHIKSLNSTIEKRDQTIIALNVDVERWKNATEDLTDLTYKQNKSIQDAADAENRAYQRYLAADKKSKPIVEALQAQINRSSVGGIEFEDCTSALNRFRNDLKGSDL